MWLVSFAFFPLTLSSLCVVGRSCLPITVDRERGKDILGLYRYTFFVLQIWFWCAGSRWLWPAARTRLSGCGTTRDSTWSLPRSSGSWSSHKNQRIFIRSYKLGSCSGGQTPWLNGRPADIDSISDQWSKFRNIAIFRKKFRKGLNQNIDQKADIWSKPSKDRNFLRKK